MIGQVKKYLLLIAFIIGGLFVHHQAAASIVSAEIDRASVASGESFAVEWFLDTQGQKINALSLTISFPADLVEARSLSEGNSLISLWTQTPTVVMPGQIALEGGVPFGLVGDRLPIFRSIFLAKTNGLVALTLDPASQILLNDGKGTQDQIIIKPAQILVQPQRQWVNISSLTHPDQSAWYSNRHAELTFTTEPNFIYAYSLLPAGKKFIDYEKMPVGAAIAYNIPQDGVYNFVVYKKNNYLPWELAGEYRMQIDSTAPESFAPEIVRSEGVFNGQQFLSFATVDKASGIAYFQVKVGLLDRFHRAQSPYKFSKPLVGDSILVRAADHAGNMRVAYIPYFGYFSEGGFFGLCILLAICLLILYWYWRRNRRKTARHHPHRFELLK